MTTTAFGSQGNQTVALFKPMFASEVLFNTHKSLLLYSNVENLHTLHHYFPVKLFVVVEMFYIWVIQKGM